MKKIVLSFLCMGLVACQKSAEPSKLSRQSEIFESEGFLWLNTAQPLIFSDTKINYFFDSSLSAEVTKGCLSAMKTVSSEVELDFTPVKDQRDAAFTFTSGQLDRANFHQGLTDVYILKSTIVSVVITFDDQIEYSRKPLPDQVDAESVCLHEILHGLALTHVPEKSSVMFYGLEQGAHKRKLSPEDRNRLRQLYRAKNVAALK